MCCEYLRHSDTAEAFEEWHWETHHDTVVDIIDELQGLD